MMRIDEYLAHNAKSYPHKVFAICNDETVTYSQFFDLVAAEAERYTQGTLVVYRSAQSINSLVTFFAVLTANAIAVPLEAEMTDDAFNALRQTLEGIHAPENTAIVLYTTGTTGKSKGVMISHNAIVSSALNLVHGQKYDSDTTFIISGPLNHIGSQSKIWPVVINGGSLYILTGLKSMEDFFNALDYPTHKVATFMVPAGLRMLMQFGSQRLSSYKDKIDFIETGAAPMAKSDMQNLCKLLPKTRLYNTYASTETGIVATYEYSRYGCIEGCLGCPLPNSKISIDADGRISVSGKTIMSGYIGDEALTNSILKDGAIYTSDNGYFDNDGLLHLTGRNDDVINVGGYKVAPSEIENHVLAINGINDCICIPTKHPILGYSIKLLYTCDDDCLVTSKDIATYLSKRVERYKIPQSYAQVDSIQRTYNGKLNRKYYIAEDK